MPVPKRRQKQQTAIEHALRDILLALGYKLDDPNICHTPKRVAKQWIEELDMTQPATKKLFSIFPEEHNQMITLTGHETWSRCPHHLERVKFRVSVGYIPNGRVLGLSKLARIADYFAKGLVLQETFADTFANGLFEALKPKGVGVHVVGNHQCMQARGVKTTGEVVTTALRGCFLEDPQIRNEFLFYCQHGGLT